MSVVLVFVLLAAGRLRWPACWRHSGATTAAVTLVLAVAVSRAGLALACVRGISPARTDGLGSGVSGTVPRAVALAVGRAAGRGSRTPCTAYAGLAGVLAAALAVGLVLLAARRKRSVASPETCSAPASRSP